MEESEIQEQIYVASVELMLNGVACSIERIEGKRQEVPPVGRSVICLIDGVLCRVTTTTAAQMEAVGLDPLNRRK